MWMMRTMLAGALLISCCLGASAIQIRIQEYAGHKYVVAGVDVSKDKLELFHTAANGKPFKAGRGRCSRW